MSLKTKFTFLISALLSLIIAGISLSLFITSKNLLTTQLEQNREKIFQNFIHTCTEALTVRDEILVINTTRSLIETHRPQVVYAGYLSPSNVVFTAQMDGMRQTEFRNRVFQVGQFVREKYVSDQNEDVIEYGLPILIRGDYAGTVKVGFSQDYLNEQIRNGVVLVMRKIILISIAALIVGIISANLVSIHLNRPIRKLSDAAKRLGDGDLNSRVEIRRRDEIGELAKAFNEMANKMKELDELKDSFVSSVSHELRSPLAAIDGYCDYLLEGLSRNMAVEKQQKALEIIRESTVRLTNFINNILDLAKIKAGRLEIKKMPVDMREIAEEIFMLFGPLSKKEEKELKINMPPDMPRIDADPERIKQVITNLLTNAIKFTPAGAEISITTRIVNEFYTEICIADTGVGIPPDELARVFDKFYQVRSTSTKKPKGTGLGLAIVAEIIKLHGGEISVESALGKGTTFKFTIPIWRPGN